MSGNFDFPPATRLPGHQHLLYQILHQRNREFNTLRADLEENVRPTLEAYRQPTGNHIPGSRRHFASRLRRRAAALPSQADQSTSTLMDHLENVTSVADSLLDQPIPSFPPHANSSESGSRESPEHAEMNRRRKRRKMDHQGRSPPVGIYGIRYGHQGSVIPGPLKMDIDYCDGGVITTPSMHGLPYAPENILRNDKSVYCTYRSHCNLVLRHMGEGLFSLTKLVIKSPASGFTAPVQEGLIFVSMSSEDLISGASHYKLVHANRIPRTEGTGNVEVNHRPMSRRRDSTVRHVPPPVSDHHDRPSNRNSSHDLVRTTSNRPAVFDFHDEPAASLQGLRFPSPPEFTITSRGDSPSSDEEVPTTPRTVADRSRRDTDPPAYNIDTSDENDIDLDETLPPEGMETLPLPTRMTRDVGGMRGRRLVEPSDIQSCIPPRSGPEVNAEKVADADENSNRDTKYPTPLAPHAHFFIEVNKSVVTIKFDPPVAGKYILLKLWSPAQGHNIDIQSVIAYGFAGPRYFPAEEML